jgi:hypothetical protein
MNQEWVYYGVATSRLRIEDLSKSNSNPGFFIMPGQLAPLQGQGFYAKHKCPCFTWDMTVFNFVVAEDDTTYLVLADTNPVELNSVRPYGEMPRGYGRFLNTLLAWEEFAGAGVRLGWGGNSSGCRSTNFECKDLYQMFQSAKSSMSRNVLFDRVVGCGVPLFYWVGDSPHPRYPQAKKSESYDMIRKKKVTAWKLPVYADYTQPNIVFTDTSAKRVKGYWACGLAGDIDDDIKKYDDSVWPNGWWAAAVPEEDDGIGVVVETLAGCRRVPTVCD